MNENKSQTNTIKKKQCKNKNKSIYNARGKKV